METLYFLSPSLFFLEEVYLTYTLKNGEKIFACKEKISPNIRGLYQESNTRLKEVEFNAAENHLIISAPISLFLDFEFLNWKTTKFKKNMSHTDLRNRDSCPLVVLIYLKIAGK